MKLGKILLILISVFVIVCLLRSNERFWFETRQNNNNNNNTVDYDNEVIRTQNQVYSDLTRGLGVAGTECVSDASCTPGLHCTEFLKNWNANSPIQNTEAVGSLANPTSKGTIKICRFTPNSVNSDCSDFGRVGITCPNN
jgi:hypothetical protein